MKIVSRVWVTSLVVFALSALGLFGQTDTAVLFGLVKDPSAASVAGARVVAHNQSTGAERELETDAKGLYYFTLLPPGAYKITVQPQRSKGYQNPAFTLHAPQLPRLHVDFQ